MTSAYALNSADIIGLLVLLAIFVFVPVVFALWISRRPHNSKPSLRGCPHCGAQNPNARERCYCCGFGFILPQSDEAEATVIQRVKQADDSNKRRRVGTQAVEGMPLEKNL